MPPKPIRLSKTTLALLALLKKKLSQSQGAIEEFSKADRQDLVDKERSQVSVLEEYAGGVGVMGREEVVKAVTQAVKDVESGGGKVTLGEVMKKLTGTGWELGGEACGEEYGC